MKASQTASLRGPISLRRTLVRQISIPILILLVTLLVTVIISASFLVISILERQHAVLDGLTSLVDQYLNETGQLVHTISDSERFLDPDELGLYLDHMREIFPRFIAFYVLDPTGKVVLESTGSPGLLGLDLSGEGFIYQEGTETARYSDPFVSLIIDRMVVTITSPVEAEPQADHGVLVAEMDLELLQLKVEDLIGSNSGETFILDSKGVYLAHPEISFVERREYYSTTPIYQGAHQDGHMYQIQKDGETGVWQIASMAELELGWQIVSVQPLGIVLQPVYYELAIAFLALVTVIVGFWINVKTSIRQISGPLASLAEKAEKISGGNYTVMDVVKPRLYREVVSLEDSFSRMVQAIQERDWTLERRVEERTNQLAEANQDLESFMYSVSHDLRAPLRAINGFSNFLSDEYKDVLDQEGQFYLERILTNSLRMDQLIDDLLNLSRLGRQSIDLSQIDMTELVNSVVEKIREQYHPCAVDFMIGDCPPVAADRHLLEIMLTNLIGNAVKFTLKCPNPRVEIGCVRENDVNIYFVRDNGVGFNMDFADKLYQPFQRLHADSDFDGSGIGLAIVGRIVRSHDASIWVESQEGQGTTFYFSFDKSNK